MEKKYKLLLDDTIIVDGRTLYRIQALRDFADVKAGDKGGYIEKEENLSQYSEAWVYGNAKVFSNAKVFGEAKVFGNAKVCDNAKVFGEAKVCDNAKVFGEAWVGGEAKVCDNAKVFGEAWIYGEAQVGGDEDYIVFKNWWSSGRHFTWTRSNNMWKVGCFYGTGEELVKKAYQDSERSGREYERIVNYVKEILKECNMESGIS